MAKSLAISALLLTGVVGLVSPALAQSDSRPPAGSQANDDAGIIVTAERRSVSLQKSALAITALTGADIAQKGFTSVNQVVEGTPGVVIQGVTGGVSTQSATGGGGAPNIAIRGVGTDGPNKNSAVAVYTDGVLIGGGGAFFYDVDRVEILRGPQGTLYGRGATAGTVNIITNDPTSEWSLSGRFGYGERNSIETQAVGNAPLSDQLALRIGVNALRSDGFFTNGESGNNEVSTRAKLLYRPSEAVSVLVGGEYYHADRTDAGTATLSTTAPDPTGWDTSEPAGGRNVITYYKAYARVNWDLDFANLTYLPAYQHNESNNIAYVSPGRVTSVSPYDHTFTQEARLVSKNPGKFSWIIGAFYYHNKYEYTLYSAAPTASGGVAGYTTNARISQDFDQSSVAIFGEGSYAFNDIFRVTLGGRQNWDSVLHTENDLTPSGPSNDYFNQDFRKFNWKARLEAHFSSDSMLYFTASTGYRPGGSQTNQKYAPENVHALEVGTKDKIADWLTIDASAFHYSYSGIQMPQAYGVFPALSFTIVSVPAEYYGGELEADLKPTHNDTIKVSPVYLHGRLTGNYAYTDPLTGVYSVISTTGATPPHQPTWSVNASYEHRFDLGDHGSLTLGGDLRYQGAQFTDFDISIYNGENNPIFRQAAYTIYNLSLRYETRDKRFGGGFYVTNLTNQIYKVSTTGPLTYLNDPRRIGGYVSFKF
jgi:iron complex outermembrane recepter protein